MIYHLSDLEQAASFSSAMEQAQFLMWTKRRHSLSSHLKLANSSPAYDDSWEEQAFAEDASGPLGGCIWPPRSYSCSFCRREFRSAQALGGHMNVHRRDRARLKQSPIASNEILDPEHRQNQATQFQNSFVSLGLPYPHNPNPNCDLPPFVSPTSPSRVSAPPSEGSCNELTLIPPYSSYGVTEHCTKSPTRSPQSWPNSAIDRCRHIINRPVIGEKHMKIVDHGQRVKEDHIKGDVPLSLNWVFGARPDPSLDTEEEHSCKRRRTDISSPIPFFLKSTAGDKNQQEKEVQELTSNPSNDVDLELRLGAPPKVKVQS